MLEEPEDGQVGRDDVDHRDYDVDHYARQLRQTFASRLVCAFTPDENDAVFADPDQMTLFMPAVTTIRTVLETKVQEVGQVESLGRDQFPVCRDPLGIGKR